jgi:hypothetical protein
MPVRTAIITKAKRVKRTSFAMSIKKEEVSKGGLKGFSGRGTSLCSFGKKISR